MAVVFIDKDKVYAEQPLAHGVRDRRRFKRRGILFCRSRCCMYAEATEKEDICEVGVPWRSCDVGESVDMIVVVRSSSERMY